MRYTAKNAIERVYDSILENRLIDRHGSMKNQGKPKLSPLRHVLEAAVASHALENPTPGLTRARYSLDKEHFR